MRARISPVVLGSDETAEGGQKYWSLSEDCHIQSPRPHESRSTRNADSCSRHLWCFDTRKPDTDINAIQILELAYILGGCGGVGDVRDDRVV